MPSIKEIEDFVKKGLDNGKPEEAIKSDLLSVGWKETDIADTIAAIKNSTPKSEGEKIAQRETNTPVNQLRFAHLKETISQYQPQKKAPAITEKISPKSRGFLSLILIPIVIALGVGARAYLKNNYPEMFEAKNSNLDIDQKILDQLETQTPTSTVSSTLNTISKPSSSTNLVPSPSQKPTSSTPNPRPTSTPQGGGNN